MQNSEQNSYPVPPQYYQDPSEFLHPPEIGEQYIEAINQINRMKHVLNEPCDILRSIKEEIQNLWMLYKNLLDSLTMHSYEQNDQIIQKIEKTLRSVYSDIASYRPIQQLQKIIDLQEIQIRDKTELIKRLESATNGARIEIGKLRDEVMTKLNSEI